MNVTFEQGAFEDFTDWATEDKKLGYQINTGQTGQVL